jgi:replicative DNA helicase
VYTVDVSGTEAQLRFANTVGGFGPRAVAVELLAQRLAQTVCNTNVDTLPIETFELVREYMRARGITTRAMAQLRGTSYGGTAHFRFAPSRQLIADYATRLEAPELTRWAESDLFWDRITGITAEGEEDVFDLTVPGPANWLADGLVTHNSGSIEQDADMILLIYRPEVYDRENQMIKGLAEIDMVKHRNGEIGEFKLTFQGQYTRFVNYMPDAYANDVNPNVMR